YMTVNNGINWNRCGSNFPFVVVTDLEIQEETNRLIAATFGVSTFSIDINELLEDIVSSTGSEQAEKIELYPNPAQDYILIEGLTQAADYQIFDMSGKLVLSGLLNNSRVNLSLPKGAYIIDLKSNERSYRKKFMVSGS
ncbi:MAG TPA: T9SS type A sorting domain-containing protein, partial [Cryomorphaceae bacterium]|nr:T9SS type A sorting domain-containing protein [Cryomorphaceae bacterium]